MSQHRSHLIDKISSRLHTAIFGIAEFAGLEFAGVENDGRSRSGGICRTGK